MRVSSLVVEFYCVFLLGLSQPQFQWKGHDFPPKTVYDLGHLILKNTYINKNRYESEYSLDIGDNIFYLVIENISEEPLFLINLDEGTIEKISSICNEIEVDCLIIKFYKKVCIPFFVIVRNWKTFGNYPDSVFRNSCVLQCTRIFYFSCHEKTIFMAIMIMKHQPK